MSNIKEIGNDQFQTEVLSTSEPVLVDFYAPWCGPCRAIAPMLDTLAGEFTGRVKFVKINVDDAMELAAKYEISGVPTLILFRSGQVFETMVGGASARGLRTKLESLLAA